MSAKAEESDLPMKEMLKPTGFIAPENIANLTFQEATEGGGGSEVLSVNGMTGRVVVSGANIDVTKDGVTKKLNTALSEIKESEVESVNGMTGKVTVDGSNIDVTKGGVTKKLNTALSEIKEVKVSETSGNALEETTEGLYVAEATKVEANVTAETTTELTNIKIGNTVYAPKKSVVRVRLTSDGNAIYKDSESLSFNEVKTLVMDETKLITLTLDDNVSFFPSAYDGDAIWFDAGFIEDNVANQLRIIINKDNQVKVDQLELVDKSKVYTKEELGDGSVDKFKVSSKETINIETTTSDAEINITGQGNVNIHSKNEVLIDAESPTNIGNETYPTYMFGAGATIDIDSEVDISAKTGSDVGINGKAVKVNGKIITETKHEITTTNTNNIVCVANARNDTLIKIKDDQGRMNTIYFLDKAHVVFTENFNFPGRNTGTQTAEGTKIYIRSLRVFTQDDNLYFGLPQNHTFEISYVGEPMTVTVGALPALKRTMYVFHEKSFIEGDTAIHWKFSRVDNECLQSTSYRVKTPYGESVREAYFAVVTNPQEDMDDIYFTFKNTDGQTLNVYTDAITTVTELMNKFETLKTFNKNSPLFGAVEGDFYGQSESGASGQLFPIGLPSSNGMYMQFKCYTADPMATACWFNMTEYNSYEDYDIDIMTQQTLDR